MIDIQKSTLERFLTEWTDEIRGSADKCTAVNITEAFQAIFGSVLIQVCFGDDISDQLLDINVPKSGGSEFESKKMNLSDAVTLVF